MTETTTTKNIWQVGPDGTTSPLDAAELGTLFDIEIDTDHKGEGSGRRTLLHADVVQALIKELAGANPTAQANVAALPAAQLLAWENAIKEGRWPIRGRPRKGDLTAGIPRLKDLGLTKQDVYRCRESAALPAEEFERRMADLRAQGRRLSHEGLVGRRRPRRKAERLLDDLRRSLPWFGPEDMRRLLKMVLDRLEEEKPKA